MFQVIFIFFGLLFYSIADNNNGNVISIRENDFYNFYRRNSEFWWCNEREYEVEAFKPLTITGYAAIFRCRDLGNKIISGIPNGLTYEVDRGSVPQGRDTWVCTIVHDSKENNIYLKIHTSNTDGPLNFVNHYIVRSTEQSQYIPIDFTKITKIIVRCSGSDDNCDVMNRGKKTGYTLRRLHEWQYLGDYSEAVYVENVYFMNVSSIEYSNDYSFADVYLSCDYCGKPDKQKATNLNCLAKTKGHRIIKVEINKIFNPSGPEPSTTKITHPTTIATTAITDGDDETSRSTVSSTSVTTTYSEATTTSTTEKFNIDDTGTRRPSTRVATTHSEGTGTITSSTEKPLDDGIIPVNNKWIAVAVAVPMLAVFFCVLTVLYKRKKLNQQTWFFRREPQNEYDYCVVNPVTPPNPEQLVYDYAVPDGPVSEGVMCENTLYNGFYSKVIPKSQRKSKNKLHAYANSSISDKIKADAGVDDHQSENTLYSCPDQKSIDKRKNSKSVHSNQENTHKTNNSESNTLYASPIDKIKANAEVAGYESINALYTYADRKSINRKNSSKSVYSNQNKSDKNDDSETNTLYASPVERINRTSIENSNIDSSNDKLINIVYSEPLDKKETADTDTYTNVTDGPHYSNKIGGYCVYPTYSEPNVKK